MSPSIPLGTGPLDLLGTGPLDGAPFGRAQGRRGRPFDSPSTRFTASGSLRAPFDAPETCKNTNGLP